MNYKKSSEILEKIKESKKILVNCHRNPDPDSIGSALAMKKVLEKMGKEVKIICATELDKSVKFLEGYNEIKVVNMQDFDFGSYDLFIILDSSSWNLVVGKNDVVKPDIFTIIIDHHQTGREYGDINIIDSKISSAAEVLYLIFQDWEIEIDKDIATSILTGIIGDTGSFRYSGVNGETLKIAADLISKGANREKIVFNLFHNYGPNLLEFFELVLKNLKVDKEHKIAWSAISFSDYKKYDEPVRGKGIVAGMFMQSVSGTEMGIIMTETERDYLTVSIRSRKEFDVSIIAKELGGGGHKTAAGCSISAPFKEAVEKVLSTAKKYAKENKK